MKTTDWIDSYKDTHVFHDLGRALSNLGLVTLLQAEYHEYESVEPGCKCGQCYQWDRELYVCVIDKDDEVVLDEVYEYE